MMYQPSHEPDIPFYKFVEMITVFDQGTISLIKSLFDQKSIPYYFEGEFSQRLIPLPFSARLMVREDYLQEAEGILCDLGLIK